MKRTGQNIVSEDLIFSPEPGRMPLMFKMAVTAVSSEHLVSKRLLVTMQYNLSEASIDKSLPNTRRGRGQSQGMRLIFARWATNQQ